MKFEYRSIKNDSRLILTNFNCAPSQSLLSDRNLYKIIWVKDAVRELTIDGYKMPLEQNQVIFCTPLHVLQVSQNKNILALVFNREFYCIQENDAEVACNGFLFYGSSIPPVVTLDEREIKSFEALFYMLQEEFETRDHIQGEMLRLLLKRLLIKSSRLIKNTLPEKQIPTSQLDVVRQYHVLVEQHFRDKHKVADYAGLLFKSPKTLSNLFKKVGESSPLQVINERIILEAKRLLLFSDKSADQIAYEIGYSDAGHFSKFFKKHTGMPPTIFKKTKDSL